MAISMKNTETKKSDNLINLIIVFNTRKYIKVIY